MAGPSAEDSQDREADAARSDMSPQGDLGLLRQMIEVASQANATQPLPPLSGRPLSSGKLKSLKRTLLSIKKGARSEELQQARQAINDLGASGDARAAELLRDHYRKAPRELIGPINRALGELKDPEAFELMLGELIAQGPSLEPGVLQGLGQLGVRHAVRPLMMFGSVFPTHRIRVIDAVVAIGEPGVRDLISLLDDSRDDAIQTATIEALGRIKDRRAVEALTPLVQHPRETIRTLTAEALGQIADKRALQILCRVLEDPSENVRLVAATALSKMPDNRVVRPMLLALNDKCPEIRAMAIQTLGACQEPRVLPKLTGFLDSPHQEERIAAAEAMGRLGSSDAVPKLLRILETTDPDDERAVLRIVDAFRRLEDPRAVLPLLNLMDSSKKLIRQRAIEALGKTGDRSARELLEAALASDPADEVRNAAAKALGEIGDPASVYALENALRGPQNLRSQAVMALGAMKSPTSTRAILELVEDPAEAVRYHVATALGELGGEEAIHALEKLTTDDADMVRRSAFKALETLGEARSEKDVKKSLKRRKAGPKKPVAGQLMHLLPSSLIGVLQQSRTGWLTAAGSLAGVAALGAIVWLGLSFWNAKPAPIPLRGDVASLSYSPDGKLLAVGRTRGMLEVWNLESQEIAYRLKDIPSAQVGFCDDSRSVVVTTGGTTALLVSLDDPDRPISLEGHENGITALSFTPDRKHFATFDSDGLVVIWDAQTRTGTSSLLLPPKAISTIALSPDATLVAGASRGGDVELWSTEAPEEPRQVLRGVGEALSHVVFSRDGSHLAAATVKGRIIVWPTDQPRPLRVFEGSNVLLPQSLDFIDLNHLFVARAAFIEHLDAEQGTARKFELNGEIEFVSNVSVNSNGGTAAVGCTENTEVCLVDLNSGDVTAILDVP